MKGFFTMEQMHPLVIFNDTTNSDDCQEKIKEQLQTLKERKKAQIEIIPHILESWKNAGIYSQEKEQRIFDCGTYIEFDELGDIVGANFCKDKLCPICQWRKSRKVFGEIMRIQKEIENYTDNFAMLTLTLKNTDELSSGISHILSAFYNFSNDRTFKKKTLGYIRTLEITYNQKTAQWHPHLHIIVALTENYFEDMITTEKWARIWQRASRIEYEPIVDIRAIGKSSTLREKAVAEVAKYAVKPFQTDGNEKETLIAYKGLYSGTKKRRLRSYGGVYAKARKTLVEKSDVGKCMVSYILKADKYVPYITQKETN